MGFLDNIFKDDKKKPPPGSASNNNNNPLANIRKNLENLGKPNTFHGQGQSLGGTKPGDVFRVVLPDQGSLGIRVEKKSNTSASAIVNHVVEGSQAERAGLVRGDILCFDGSNGQDEIPYDLFLDLAKSPQRPIRLEARRFVSSAATQKTSASADVEARRKAMIAAAEAREKKHKKQTKPMQRVTKSTLQAANHNSNSDVNIHHDAVPQTEESRLAAEAAKRNEAQTAAQLGYNPYEVVTKTAGQARSATTATQHGSIQGPAADTAGTAASIPKVAPPRNPTTPVSALPREFVEALQQVDSKKGLQTARKLAINATTKGQNLDSGDSDKYRKVRLENPKIRQLIVDVPGNVELLLQLGFQLAEDAGESLLVFPPNHNGPSWFDSAVQAMEDKEATLH